MVNTPKKRDYPSYALETVRGLARRQSVLVSKSAQKSYENLEYGFDEVCACLTTLSADDFHESVQYRIEEKWKDVYRVRYVSPTGHLDDLYIKFELTSNFCHVHVVSFHEERDV